MDFTIICKTLEELKEARTILFRHFSSQRVFAFRGEMGSGKTTFIRTICKELGTLDSVSSPTYGIVNEYALSNDERIYHFDFYRIKHVEEAIAIGFDEYISSGAWCFIEWPEKIESLLPTNYVDIKIIEEQEVRTIHMQNHSGNVSLGD